MKQKEQSKVKPVHEIKLSRLVAAIWRNENKDSAWYNVTFERSYRDEEELKSSQSFGRDDLLLLAKIANEAHSLIFALQREERAAQD